MKRFLVVVIIMCVILTGCESNPSREQITFREQIEEVSGIVTDKEEQPELVFIPGMNAFLPTGKTRYLVTITYEHLSQTFENQDLYETVEEGDTIQVVLHETYIGNQVFDKTLKLIETTE